MTKKILSIDGGGVRAEIPAMICDEMEQRSGKSCADLFDFIAGNSGGGIVACGLVARVPASRMVRLFSDDAAQAFTPAWPPSYGATRPRYDAAPLEDLLHDVLGDTWLSQTTGPELLVTSYSLDLNDAYFFKSWKARGTALNPKGDPNDIQDDLDFKLWQIARATSAAQTYFPTACIESKSGKKLYMTDGGTHINNPSMAAWASAVNLWGHQQYSVLSLGTGHAPTAAIDGPASVHWGALEWITEGELLEICMNGTASVTSYELDCLNGLGVDSARIQPVLPLSAAKMDNVKPANIKVLQSIAQQAITNNTDIITRFCT